MPRMSLMRIIALVMALVTLGAADILNKAQMDGAGKDTCRYLSERVTGKTPGRIVDAEADLTGATYVTLVVTEGGDGYACDHADWLEARLTGPKGETRLTALDWVFATAGWGQVRKNRRAADGPLTIEGKTFDNGIGTHSPSMIVFKLPYGFDRFRARCGMDDSGASHGFGCSVQFAVFAGLPNAVQAQMLGIKELPDLEAIQAIQAMDVIKELARQRHDETGREFVGLCDDLARRNLTSTFHRGIFDATARAQQALHPAALLLESDRDPVDVVLRRTRALWDDLNSKTDLKTAGDALTALDVENRKLAVMDGAARLSLFEKATALRRDIAFANPLLKGMDRILFITRNALPFDYRLGNHMCDQFFGFHATLHGKSRGDGLFVLERPFSKQPAVTNLLRNSQVENGRLKGTTLARGGFLAPDLSYDGRQILFAWTEGADPDGKDQRVWNEHTTFHLFKVDADGGGLTQLTDGPWNEIDPCWLPNGRIVFVSERRGGFGRCHGRPVPNFTVHSMFDDGTDIVRFSPHETNEWQPSIDNSGMIVYTRWDYVDRGFNQAHHAWTTFPDGRDSRSINGNTHVSERTAPHMEMDVRAIPNSTRYVAIASGHHTESRGSIILIDPHVRDDNAMAQVKRVTPDQLFPEAEFYRQYASGAYATPWPLSETYYLCVYDHEANNQYADVDAEARRYALCLVDAFGNKEILYRNPDISCLSPMPFQARPKPPIIAHGTLLGRPATPDGKRPEPIAADKLPKTAKVGCMNVYESMLPMPPGTKVTHLRIWQVLPKSTPNADQPKIGMGSHKPAKACLGTVPVEDDGSAYWEQPVGIPVLFHALDENGMAVQGMRSVTYTQPGETLFCNGCHEQRNATTSRRSSPKAMKRPPSVIMPEMDGTNPFSFPRLVQPVLEAKCVACHQKENRVNKRAIDLTAGDFRKNPDHFYTSFNNLRPFVFFYDNAVFTEPSTIPGRFGARASKLYEILAKGHYDAKLSTDEMLRLTIWMDSNCLFYGHEKDLDAQAEGKVVPPALQ